ncbi:MAG TPA: SusC/RagA family TonB-linked outer membrane protein, partial [Flavisolibacter sp.]|nr:SusC/RagA family TonB-linked outer membrane protein [Flavisolibacter sp.]
MAGCLFVLPLLFSAASHAQNSVSYASVKTAKTFRAYPVYSASSQEKQTLLTVLKDLNRVKGVYFLFSEESMGNILVKAAKDYAAETEKILAEVLKDTGLKFKKVSANTYVIVHDKEKGKIAAELMTIIGMGTTTTDNIAAKNLRAPITGRVTTPDGQPLPGVSIRVKGTSRGTTTNARGEFTIEANKGETLVVSYVGYQPSETTIGDNTSLTLSLTASDSQLSEVVVTALGVRRERKALGYSVTEVKGDELTRAREVNVMNSLVGKVAGLNVSSVAGGPGSASNVIIRGVSSLGQDPKLGQTNQPLYVINGVPMESQPASQPGGQYDNGPDRGDAIGNLNPDDIETISVLKGAAASALYGYRAKAGVILITTKSGRGNGIEFNSNYVAEKIMDLTDWQYEYGQGANNIKPTTQMAAFQAGQSSWGGRLDGSQVIQFDGVSRPYVAQQNNLKNFYRTGGTFTNTLAFNKTFTGGALRFSASNLSNNAVIPNSGLDRQTFNLAANFNPTKNLVIDARANYILEQAKNRPFLSDGPGNANFNLMFLPTSVDARVLEKRVNGDGSEYGYSANTFATNPYFAAYDFVTNTNRNRLISSVTVRYNFDNGLFVQGRAGRDAYTDRYMQVVPTGTAYRVNGSIAEQNYSFSDLNVDGLAGKTFSLSGGNFSITPNIGASFRKLESETFTNSGSDFAVPFVYNIGNAKFKGVEYLVSDQEIHSVYGTLEFAVKDFLFVTGSARNDWFSTLATPGRDNKLNIIYPAVSTSFVFSECFKPSWLSFGKIRAGYAVVGQATGPYNTQLSYGLLSPTLNGLPLGIVSNGNVPNPALQPSEASEFEIGTE